MPVIQQKIMVASQKFLQDSIYYDYAPRSFQQVGAMNIERQNEHKLRNENDFNLPNQRLEQFKKFAIYSLPHEWNNAGVITYLLWK